MVIVRAQTSARKNIPKYIQPKMEILESTIPRITESRTMKAIIRAFDLDSRFNNLFPRPKRFYIVAITFSSIPIGVGRQLISIVVRQGWLSLKYSAYSLL